MDLIGRKYTADGFEPWAAQLNDEQAHEVRALAREYAARIGNAPPTDEDYIVAANTLHGRRGCKPNISHGDILIDTVAR